MSSDCMTIHSQRSQMTEMSDTIDVRHYLECICPQQSQVALGERRHTSVNKVNAKHSISCSSRRRHGLADAPSTSTTIFIATYSG